MEQQKPAKQRWFLGFLTIAVGQSVSLIGSSAVQFALIWWLAIQTSSPIMLSMASLCAFIPQLVLGPFAGVWIDRMKRKTVIICADLFIGFIAVILSACFFVGEPSFWVVCVILGIRSVGNVFHTPAIQSAIPMLIPQDQLMRANSWSQFMQSGAFMLGPVAGAAMFAALPMWIILLSDFVGALVASGTVAAVNIPNPPRLSEKPRFFREMLDGLLVFVKDKRLLITIIAATFGMIFFMPLSTFYPLMTSDYFKASAWHAGAVEFLFAAGMMVCAAVLSVCGNIKNKLLWIHIAMFGMGFSGLLAGLIPPTITMFWLFAALCCLMGATMNLYNTPLTTYMQETMPPEAMGRAFSLLGSLMSITMPVGLLFAGPIAETHGVAVWFVISGAAYAVIAIVSAVFVLPLKKNHSL